MKKVTVILAMLTLMISTNLFAQNNENKEVERIAREILEAYKTKNPELLKKNVSGILKSTITKDYFNTKSLQDDIKAAENWDGKIRAIGYKTVNLFGKKIQSADVYFADVEGTNKIYVVLLSKMGDNPWVAVGSGIGKEKKSEFEELSKTKLSEEEEEETNSKKNYSVEMANGDTFSKVTFEKIKECFNKMDDDNFFIILNGEDENEFLQAAYSDKGYSVEYKANGVQYEAKEVLQKEVALNLFKNYLNEDENWNKSVEWEKQQ